MNIFILDSDPKLIAQYHVDRHVVKMILESLQLLSTTLRLSGVDYGYKSCYVNHPCRIWVGNSLDNFLWLKELTKELCQEYTFRYEKIHKGESLLEDMPLPNLLSVGLTPFALAMPEEYKADDPIVSYRNYYKYGKKHLHKYTKREMPEWLK